MKWQTVLTGCTALLLIGCGEVTKDTWPEGCFVSFSVGGVVRDQRGEPVNGAEVLLRKSNGTTWRHISGSSPSGGTVPAGTLLLHWRRGWTVYVACNPAVRVYGSLHPNEPDHHHNAKGV